MAVMAIGIGSSNRLLLPITVSTSNRGVSRGGERKRPPFPIFISTNPSHINIDSLSNLYRSCSHSPLLRHPSTTTAVDIDSEKLAVAVSHSSVVVSVFAQIDGGGGERDRGLWERFVPKAAENGELVGFGRAVSDMGLTASIHDVMVIPPLRLMGIGRMIVQRILRSLSIRGIYDISALCSEKERLFFEACSFGDDILGSTTMMYIKTTSSDLDGREIIKEVGRRPSTLL